MVSVRPVVNVVALQVRGKTRELDDGSKGRLTSVVPKELSKVFHIEFCLACHTSWFARKSLADRRKTPQRTVNFGPGLEINTSPLEAFLHAALDVVPNIGIPLQLDAGTIIKVDGVGVVIGEATGPATLGDTPVFIAHGRFLSTESLAASFRRCWERRCSWFEFS